MEEITVFELKRLGLTTDNADAIYITTEINQKIKDGDILGAFELVAHAQDLHVEELQDEIDELEDDLEIANNDLDEANDRADCAEEEAEELESQVARLESILDKHNIPY